MEETVDCHGESGILILGRTVSKEWEGSASVRIKSRQPHPALGFGIRP